MDQSLSWVTTVWQLSERERGREGEREGGRGRERERKGERERERGRERGREGGREGGREREGERGREGGRERGREREGEGEREREGGRKRGREREGEREGGGREGEGGGGERERGREREREREGGRTLKSTVLVYYMYCMYSRSSSTYLLPSFCVLFINNDLLANSKFLMITISSHIVCNLIGSTVCVESCSSLLTLQRALLLASSLREKEVVDIHVLMVHVHINVHVYINVQVHINVHVHINGTCIY